MTAATLLAVLAAAISHSPYHPQDCAYTVPVLALSRPPVIAGNMRTTDGGCIVWEDARTFTGRHPRYGRKAACQSAVHELGHLAGLPHSPDPDDVMFSPFVPLRRSFC